MTMSHDLDARVGRWLVRTAPPQASSRLLTAVLERVEHTRQERHIAQRLFGDRLGRSRELRVALAVAALVALLAATVAAGSLIRTSPNLDPIGGGWIVVSTGTPGAARDILQVGQGGNARPLVDFPADETCPAYAPDGRTLAYIENNSSLVLAPVDDSGIPVRGQARRYAVPAANLGDACFAWSPNSKMLARLTNPAHTGSRIGLFRVELETFNEARAERSRAVIGAFTFGHDSTAVIGSASGDGIQPGTNIFASIDTVAAGFLTSFEFHNSSWLATSMSLSPDGTRLAVGSRSPGEVVPGGQPVVELLLIGLTGRDLVAERIEAEPPIWSPDGRWIAAFSRDHASILVFDMDLRNQRALRLSLPPAGLRLAWSPDSTRLVYLARPDASNTALVVVPLAEGQRPAVLPVNSFLGGYGEDFTWAGSQP